MERRKPIWTGASFLVYAGGLSVFGAALAANFAGAWSQGGTGEVCSDSGTLSVCSEVEAFGLRGWVPPLVFAITGFLLVALGLASRRRTAS
jgi:hypothetical protein